VDRSVGPLQIDFERRIVTVDDDEIELTRTEFDILATLAKRPGAAITRRRLVERCLDEEREGTERTLDVHVSRIRKKLGDASDLLQTVWGIGYKLEPPEE
jgi:two-component system response regulator MtrA